MNPSLPCPSRVPSCRGVVLTCLLVVGAAATAAPPVARHDQVLVPASWNTLGSHAPISIPVLANDSDPEGDSLTITEVSTARLGSVTHDGTTITYTPYANPVHASIRVEVRSDWFWYQVGDGHGGVSTGYVALASSAPPAVGAFCYPERYTARTQFLDTIENRVVDALVSFDLGENAMRLQSLDRNPYESPVEALQILRPSDGYRYLRPTGGECTRMPYTVPLHRPCFDPATTPYLGHVVMGRQPVTRWLVPHADGSHSIHVIADAGPNMIPVSQEQFRGATLLSRVAYRDFARRSIPFPDGTFSPPGECLP